METTSENQTTELAVYIHAASYRLLTLIRQFDAAKISLGERGPVWWDDGPRDYNRCMVKNTPYRSWHEQLVGPKNS